MGQRSSRFRDDLWEKMKISDFAIKLINIRITALNARLAKFDSAAANIAARPNNKKATTVNTAALGLMRAQEARKVAEAAMAGALAALEEVARDTDSALLAISQLAPGDLSADAIAAMAADCGIEWENIKNNLDAAGQVLSAFAAMAEKTALDERLTAEAALAEAKAALEAGKAAEADARVALEAAKAAEIDVQAAAEIEKAARLAKLEVAKAAYLATQSEVLDEIRRRETAVAVAMEAALERTKRRAAEIAAPFVARALAAKNDGQLQAVMGETLSAVLKEESGVKNTAIADVRAAKHARHEELALPHRARKTVAAQGGGVGLLTETHLGLYKPQGRDGLQLAAVWQLANGQLKDLALSEAPDVMKKLNSRGRVFSFKGGDAFSVKSNPVVQATTAAEPPAPAAEPATPNPIAAPRPRKPAAPKSYKPVARLVASDGETPVTGTLGAAMLAAGLAATVSVEA